MTEQPLSNWFDERIEAWLDGELSGSEAALFEARLAADPRLEREVDRAINLAAQLKELPSLSPPRSLTRGVMDMTGSGFSLPRLALPARGRSLGSSLGWSLGGACAAALALMVTLGPVSLPGGGEAELQPTAQELAQARADLALALGYVDHAGDMAARQLGTQAGAVTVRSLLKPARRLNSDGADTI